MVGFANGLLTLDIHIHEFLCTHPAQVFPRNGFPHVGLRGKRKTLWKLLKTGLCSPHGFRQGRSRAGAGAGEFSTNPQALLILLLTYLLKKEKKTTMKFDGYQRQSHERPEHCAACAVDEECAAYPERYLPFGEKRPPDDGRDGHDRKRGAAHSVHGAGGGARGKGETVVSGKSFREFVSRLPDTNRF